MMISVGYTLEALIVSGVAEWPEPITRLRQPVLMQVPDGLSLGLLPLTAALKSALGVDDRDDPILGFYELRRPVAELATEASLTARVVYVHAEFFGGTGFQAAVGWLDGAIAFGPRFTANAPGEAEEDYEVVSCAMKPMAIDEALQFLGVRPVGGRDEFATIGLGAHRSTEEW